MVRSPGAVGLPPAHISVRVAWHDTDWTGRVCRAPAANHACTILKNVAGRKDGDAEEADAGTAWTDLHRDRVPPCVFERAGFMRPAAYSITRDHAYAKTSRSHRHFTTTTHRMPAYSLEATPYRWVMRDQCPDRVRTMGVGYDIALRRPPTLR